jgi:hypothetical protein
MKREKERPSQMQTTHFNGIITHIIREEKDECKKQKDDKRTGTASVDKAMRENNKKVTGEKHVKAY